MTSLVSLAIGVGCMLILYAGRHYAFGLANLVLASVALMWLVLSSEAPIVATLTRAVGRDPTFTARTWFWPVLLAEGMKQPVLGVGFGGYFNTPGNWLQETYGYVVGHNGLLDVFLETGLAGVLLTIAFHVALHRRLCYQLKTAFDSRVFGLCFLTVSWIANFSESLFLKNTSLIWTITILLAVVLLDPDRERLNHSQVDTKSKTRWASCDTSGEVPVPNQSPSAGIEQ